MKHRTTLFIIIISLVLWLAPSTVWSVTVTPVKRCAEYASNQQAFAGHASVVWFYMGDAPEITLLQEMLVLNKAFKGYDHKVLFYDTDATAFSKVSSAKAIAEADEVYDPTSDNFFNGLIELFDAGYVVDIYIVSHGEVLSSGDPFFVAMDGLITGSDILERLGSWGCGEVPIRMVYSGACYHSEMSAYWREVGAKVAAGARYINFYPNQFMGFAEKWTSGKTFHDAIDQADNNGSRTAAQLVVYGAGWSYRNKGECGAWPNVLGENDCAEWFFTEGGPYVFDDGEYHSNWSGKSNMNYSSTKLINGESGISKNTVLTWTMPE